MPARTAPMPAAALLAALMVACQPSEPGAPEAPAPTPPPAAATADAELAAEVAGEAISIAELDAWIKEDLFRSQASTPSKLYELRSLALEQMLAERLLEAEARRRGASPEQVLRQEVAALGPVSDDEVASFYADNSDRLGGATLEQISEQIRSYLASQREQTARQALRETADVRIHIEPPRVEVAATGPAKGPAGARITIVEFSDFQCPFCQRVLPTLERVLETYPDDVRLVYRHLPLRSHSRARPAAEASLCAADQGGFWPYHDALFANTRALADADLVRYAAETGLDAERLERCLKEQSFAQQVTEDAEAARVAGITGTPAFVVNGILLSGARPFEDFVRVIDAELERLGDG